MKEPNEELDFALHVLYLAVHNYPCAVCDFSNICKSVNCVLKEAFDTVHQ